MRELTNIYFKRDERQIIVVANLCATWTDDKNKLKKTFDKASLKWAINFLLDLCFAFNIGNLVFQQIIWIATGSDPTPVIGHLFLYYYEIKWLQGDSNPQPVWIKGAGVFVYELSGCGFKSHCSHSNFRYRACFKQGGPWHSGNYRVWIHSKTRAWHYRNIQSMRINGY